VLRPLILSSLAWFSVWQESEENYSGFNPTLLLSKVPGIHWRMLCIYYDFQSFNKGIKK